jgi:hypothetical protein
MLIFCCWDVITKGTHAPAITRFSISTPFALASSLKTYFSKVPVTPCSVMAFAKNLTKEPYALQIQVMTSFPYIERLRGGNEPLVPQILNPIVLLH